MTVNYLSRLGDVLLQDANRHFRMTDPVMALWLRWRSPGGAAVPMTTIGNHAEQQAAEALAKLV